METKKSGGGQNEEYRILTIEEVRALRVDNISRDSLCMLGLPVVDIETINGEIPVCEIAEKPYDYCMGQSITNVSKVPGKLCILENGKIVYNSGDYKEDERGIIIRLRGNTSCTLFEKKPYKIKLQKSADLLFRENEDYHKDKEWLLIKDENLYSLLGLKVNELVGMDWTPAYQYVNVIINREYKGLYMLIESVKRKPKGRINVAKDGYLFEYDAYWWNEPYFVKSKVAHRPMQYTVKYPKPEDMDETDKVAFENMIQVFEKAAISGNYEDVIDKYSFVNWILGHDILGSWDGDGSNYYITKFDSSKISKVKMSTMWDFDTILSTKDKWDGAHDKFVYEYLFKDAQFINEYVKRYEELRFSLFEYVRDWLLEIPDTDKGNALALSMILNNKRWPNSNKDLNTTLAEFLYWMKEREAWLTAQCNDMKNIKN